MKPKKKKLSKEQIAFIKRLNDIKHRLTRDRDDLQEMLDEIDTIIETADRAEEYLGAAIDSLSEYL